MKHNYKIGDTVTHNDSQMTGEIIALPTTRKTIMYTLFIAVETISGTYSQGVNPSRLDEEVRSFAMSHDEPCQVRVALELDGDVMSEIVTPL